MSATSYFKSSNATLSYLRLSTVGYISLRFSYVKMPSLVKAAVGALGSMKHLGMIVPGYESKDSVYGTWDQLSFGYWVNIENWSR